MIIDLQVDDVAYLYATSQPNVVEFLEEIRKVREEQGELFLFPTRTVENIQPIYYDGKTYVLVFKGYQRLTFAAELINDQCFFVLDQYGFKYVTTLDSLPVGDGYFDVIDGGAVINQHKWVKC